MQKPSTEIKPRLSIVGAGPGDPDLITVKGVRALREADVVLYDALVSRELLDHAPVQALRIYVGKKPGNHSFSQEEINALIVQYAFSHGHVVRLKGGDPFVFGRGHEEMEHAEALGIEVTVVPGVSSAIAVPELQKIPLTRRNVSESFWVVTGTTSGRRLSDDIRLAAQSNATVIVLMGMNRIGVIARLFARYGKKDTPAAVIQNGSLPGERRIAGRVHNIARLAKEAGLTSPAVIVVGETAGLQAGANLALSETRKQEKS